MTIDVSPVFFRWATYLRDKILSGKLNDKEKRLIAPENIGKFAALRPVRLGLLCEILDEKREPVYLMTRHVPEHGDVAKPYYSFTISAAEVMSTDDWHQGSLECIASKMLYEETGIRTSEKDVEFWGCAWTPPGRFFDMQGRKEFNTPLVFGVVRPRFYDMTSELLCSQNDNLPSLPKKIFRGVFKFRKNQDLLPDDAFDAPQCYLTNSAIPDFLRDNQVDKLLRLLLAKLYSLHHGNSQLEVRR